MASVYFSLAPFTPFEGEPCSCTSWSYLFSIYLAVPVEAVDPCRCTVRGQCRRGSVTRSLAHRRVSIRESSVSKLGSVCRRVYRIFAHAYFHHRQLFDEFEVRARPRGRLSAGRVECFSRAQ